MDVFQILLKQNIPFLTYKAAVAKMRTAYNKGLRRLLLYKLDNIQFNASEMFVAINVDSLDVLIRKSFHGLLPAL